VSGKPDSQPMLWLKALIAVLVFIVGNVFFVYGSRYPLPTMNTKTAMRALSHSMGWLSGFPDTPKAMKIVFGNVFFVYGSRYLGTLRRFTLIVSFAIQTALLLGASMGWLSGFPDTPKAMKIVFPVDVQSTMVRARSLYFSNMHTGKDQSMHPIKTEL
jgi:hypothetical protein